MKAFVIVAAALAAAVTSNGSAGRSVGAADPKPNNFTYLSEGELTFLDAKWRPFTERVRDPNPYRATEGETIAFCKMLLDGCVLQDGTYIDPVFIKVTSCGTSAQNRQEGIQNLSTTGAFSDRPESGFVWMRIAVESQDPTIIVDGTIRIRDQQTKETLKVVLATRRYEMRKMKWELVQIGITEVGQKAVK